MRKLEGLKKKEKKFGFFKRIYISIFKVDEYSNFLEEKFRVVVKYYLLLIALVALIVAIPLIKNYNDRVTAALNYIQNELPEFTIEDAKYISTVNDVEGYDERFDSKVYINTDVESFTEEKMAEVVKDLSIHQYGILIMQDEMRLFTIQSKEPEKDFTTISYKSVIEYLEISEDTKIDKEYISNLVNEYKVQVWVELGLIIYATLFIANVVAYVLVMLVISVVGYSYNMIYDLKLSLQQVFTLAMYSCTLGILLVTVVNVLSLFKTMNNLDYIEVIQILVSVIYLVAALMIIRVENNKVKQEIGQVATETGVVGGENAPEVLEENKKEDKTKEEKKEEDKEDSKKDEDKKDDEPDGSEI